MRANSKIMEKSVAYCTENTIYKKNLSRVVLFYEGQSEIIINAQYIYFSCVLFLILISFISILFVF